MLINEDLDRLIEILPKSIQQVLQNHPEKHALVEIVMDLGRRPEARFPNTHEYLSPKLITWQDLDYSVKRLSQFTDDNRAGIERTLHRISCIRNRQGLIIGLTCRVGRAIYGTINIIRDLLESKKSTLILGQPGVGKTTMVREIARVIANEMSKRVVIIDTSNEIAGDSDVPHIGIGRARRMQVEKTELQHKIMIEAVENHMPEVIIIDEIGTELEALAAQTIAERGVQLIGTAHGNCLGSLIKNPTLSDLVGGIQYVTLSDEEARRRGTQKSILERKGLPAFQIAIELNDRNFWTIHENVENSIDKLLQGLEPKLQVRSLDQQNKAKIALTNLNNQNLIISNVNSSVLSKHWRKNPKAKNPSSLISTKVSAINTSPNMIGEKIKKPTLSIFLFSVSSTLIQKYLSLVNFDFILVNEVENADVIIALEKHFKMNVDISEYVKIFSTPFFLVKQNTPNEIIPILENISQIK
jgi:stage III sporulation protein SpoIIIAA